MYRFKKKKIAQNDYFKENEIQLQKYKREREREIDDNVFNEKNLITFPHTYFIDPAKTQGRKMKGHVPGADNKRSRVVSRTWLEYLSLFGDQLVESDQTVNSFHLHTPRIDIDLRRGGEGRKGGRGEGRGGWLDGIFVIRLALRYTYDFCTTFPRSLFRSMYRRETTAKVVEGEVVEGSKFNPLTENGKNSSGTLVGGTSTIGWEQVE